MEPQLSDEQQNPAERLRAAVEELYGLTPDLFAERAVREEVYDLAVTRYREDRFVSLGDLLTGGAAEVYDARFSRPGGVRGRGAFARAFAARFDPAETPNLARYVERGAGGELDVRDGARELFFYCPYCDDVPVEAVDSVTVAPVLDQPGPAAAGTLVTPSGSEAVSVDEAYAQQRYTLQITATQGGTGRTTNYYGEECYQYPTEIVCCYFDADGSVSECRTVYEVPQDPPPSGGGGGRSGKTDRWQDCDERARMFTGNIRLTETTDGFWSIADGGGTEVRMGQVGVERIVQAPNNRFAATGFSQQTGEFYVTRRRIRRRAELWWGTEIVNEWECEDGDRWFVIYDDDPVSERQVAPSFRPSTTIPVGGVPIEVGTTIGLGEVTIESEDTPFLVTTMSRDNYFDLNREEFRGCGTKSPTEEAPLNVFDDVEYTKFCLEGGQDDGYITLPDVY